MNGNGNNSGSTGIRRVFALIGAPLRRRMTADPILAITFMAVILITATAVAAIPIILNRVGDQGLLEALDRSIVIQRSINVELEDKLPTSGPDPLELITERGENYRDNLPDSLQTIIGDTQWTSDSPRHNHLLEGLTVASGSLEQYFQFRYQSGLEDQIRLIEGREPEPADPVLLSEVDTLPEDVEDESVQTFEVMIGRDTAETKNLGIGDYVVLLPDNRDLLNRGAFRGYFEQPIAVRVSGIFEAIDPESEFWYFDYRTYRTDVVVTPEQTVHYSMGIPAPEVIGEIQALNEPGRWRYSWRYFVDSNSVTMANNEQITTDLRNVSQNLGPYQELSNLEPVQAARQVNVRTLLPTLLSSAQRQYRLTAAVLSLVIAGIVTIGLALSGLLGALVASRRMPQIALMRSRGASPRQLSFSQITEGLLLALPAALLGILFASLLTNGRPVMDSIIAAIAVGIVGVIALWALTRRIWTVDLGQVLGRRADPFDAARGGLAGSSQRRIVVEALVVGLAIAGVILLRQRGVTTGAAQEGVDPYVAAVPVLAGLATGIVTVRLFPWLLRQLARLAGRRPDIVPFFGLRRIAEPSLGRHLPLVVMILALGMAIFAGAIWYSIETPQPLPLDEMTQEEIEALPPVPGVNEAFQEGISQGFWLTIFLAGIYAILAVLCALALTADERRRDVGYLRTMGASRRQAVGLTLIEQIPSALLAGIIGVAFGGLLTWLIAPGLDIASLYPADEPVIIGINWLLAIAQSLALIVVAIAAAIGFAFLARRSDLTDVLRAGE